MRLADNLSAKDAPEVAESLLHYLENTLPMHLADEEEDLFPLLRQRSSPGDKVVAVLDLLSAEHRDDIEYGRSLLEPLRLIAAGREPPDPAMFAHYVRAFRILERRHQAMENNVVMPLAFERLGPEDKVDFGRKMAARRKLPYSE